MIRTLFRVIHFLPAWIIYKLYGNEMIHDEFKIWCDNLRIDYGSEYKNFLFLMSLNEYRTTLYWRLGSKALISKLVAPPHVTLYISTASNKVAKGLFIEHGHSTIIHATQIGENCHIWQNVTIGKEKQGGTKPVIGNNVYIYTGAVVIGNITIGDNVIVGANSVVTKSVPNNCTVVGNPALIIRRNGVRVTEKL